MTRITLTITEDEREALQEIAQQERRDPRSQAALLLRKALQTSGYLQATVPARQEWEVLRG